MTPGGRFEGGRFADSGRTRGHMDPWASYAANGLQPDVVSDFRSGAYRGLDSGPVSFDQMFALSRTTEAAYTNAEGILSLAPPGGPRFDHVWQDGQWVCRGLLIESAARTNLLRHSQGFDQPVWSKSRAVVAANDHQAPDGTHTASRLTSTASTFDGAVRQTISYASGDRLSFAVYAKAGDRPFLFLRERTKGFAKDSYFDLANGVPGTVNSAHSAQMTHVGGGWYRCAISVTATQTAATGFEIYNSQDDLNTGSTQPGFTYIWGAQLEQGPEASSYISTSDQPETRSAEAVSLQASQMIDPSLSGGVSLALAGRERLTPEGGQAVLIDWSAGVDDYVRHSVSPGTGQLSLDQSSATGAVQITSAPGAIAEGQAAPYSIASRHLSNQVEAALDGALVNAASVDAIPDLTAGTLSLAPDYMGHIALFRLWRGDIASAGLQQASG